MSLWLGSQSKDTGKYAWTRLAGKLHVSQELGKAFGRRCSLGKQTPGSMEDAGRMHHKGSRSAPLTSWYASHYIWVGSGL